MRQVRFSHSYANQLNRVLVNEMMKGYNKATSFNNSHLPSANIKEDEDKFEVALATPGLSKEQLKINLDNGKLTISFSEEEKAENKEQFVRREFAQESFKRVFSIPDSVDVSRIAAKYNNGILTVELPKKEEAKLQPSKDIDIA